MSGPVLLLTSGRGGIGNRVFPFANALAFAEQTHGTVFHLGFQGLEEQFAGTSGSGVPVYPPPPHRRTVPRQLASTLARAARYAGRLHLLPYYHRPDSEPFLLPPSGISHRVFVVDALHVLAHPALPENLSRVRSFFAPRPALREKVAHTIRRLHTDVDILVGIHVRQGDYQFHHDGLLHYETGEYVALMRTIADLLSPQTVRFVVCSNVTQPLELFAQLDVDVSQRSAIEDLFLLAACDLIAGPPSTFSQWASFFGNTPLYPLNQKEDARLGRQPTHLSRESFTVQGLGFGRFSKRQHSQLPSNEGLPSGANEQRQ